MPCRTTPLSHSTLTPQGKNISCKRCPASLLSSEKGKTPKHLPLHQPGGLASPPLPETPTGRVWTRYTAPTGGSKLSRKKTVTSSLCHIIQQHTAVVRVVSSTGIGLSSTAVVVVVNFQSFGPSRPDRRLNPAEQSRHGTAVVRGTHKSTSTSSDRCVGL